MHTSHIHHTPKQNHLLAALPTADYERLLPHLELVPLPLAWAVYESGSQQGYVYFLTTSIVSLLHVMQEGASAEIAVVGNEGVTEAAGKLQAVGLIYYSRGKITVLDGPGLEVRACECYAVVKRESDRLLSGNTAFVEQPV